MIIQDARELLTLAGKKGPRCYEEMNELAIIEKGSVVVKNGRIVAVGTKESIAAEYNANRIIDARGKVVMPGFVDPHTHPVFFGTREKEFEMRILGKSYVEISQEGGGIRSSIAGVRQTSEEELYQLSLNRIRRIISCGTTTLEAKSGYGLSTASELKMLRVINRIKQELPIDIIPTFLGAHEFPAEYKDNRQEYIRILKEEMIPAVAKEGLAEYCDIFTEKHVFSVAESRDILKTARDYGFKIRMHADEIEPIGGASLAAEMKAVSADHLGSASSRSIISMKKAGVIPILLPATIFSLGLKNYAQAREMIDKGLPVALATDFNPGSCNCDSMQFVITLSCLQMRMTVAEAIVASTINAAWSLQRGKELGSLEPGKKADILVMDMPSYRYLPYHFGSNNVAQVYKEGRLVYENNI